jgi:peptidoglycan-associated lipoprotein
MRPPLLVSLFVAACAHHAAPAMVASGEAGLDHAAPPSAIAEVATTTGQGSSLKEAALGNSKVDCENVRVLFAYDSSQLSDDDRDVLMRAARCLASDQKLTVTVEGNADERGTEEYNLALGDRRAAAVQSYLAQLGARPAQVRTVSFGKENPLCTDHDEACWSKNRRADVKLTSFH